MPESELRSRVLQRLEDGRLPLSPTAMLAASYGSGRVCSLCDEPIARHHVEYELTDPRSGRRLAFHRLCHDVWQIECLRRSGSVEP